MITLNLSTIVAVTQIALESTLYIKIATIIARTCKDYRNIGNIPSSNQSETCLETWSCRVLLHLVLGAGRRPSSSNEDMH